MPAATPLLAAVILAGGVTALVAIGMMILSLHRSARLNVVRGALSLALVVGVIAIPGFGVVALSAQPAQATPNFSQPSVQQQMVDSGTGPTDIQLPTE